GRGAGDVDVIGVEEDDEHARARTLRHRSRLGHAVRLDARLLRSRGTDDDVLELLDLLRRAVLEYFKVVGAQISDRRAVLRRIDVDADVVRFGAERRWRLGRLLGRRLLRRLRGRRRGQG